MSIGRTLTFFVLFVFCVGLNAYSRVVMETHIWLGAYFFWMSIVIAARSAFAITEWPINIVNRRDHIVAYLLGLHP